MTSSCRGCCNQIDRFTNPFILSDTQTLLHEDEVGEEVTFLSSSPSNDIVLFTGHEGGMLMRREDNDVVHSVSLESDWINCMCLSSDGTTLYVAHSPFVEAFDSNTLASQWRYEDETSHESLGQIALNECDGELVVGLAGEALLTLDMETGAVRRRLEGSHMGPVLCAARVASESDGGSHMVWCGA
jgi:WD40 repeat protein